MRHVRKWHAGLQDWGCAFTSDDEACLEAIERQLASYAISEPVIARSTIEVNFGSAREPTIRVQNNGQSVELPDMFGRPEWGSMIKSPTAPGVYTFAAMPGLAVARTVHGYAVIKREHWLALVCMCFQWLLLRELPFVEVHGATLAYAGRALIILGASGAGKSTLCWALKTLGADYYSDESVLFDLEGFGVRVYPRPIGLRPGGIRALADPSLRATSWSHFKPDDPKCFVAVPGTTRPCPSTKVRIFCISSFSDSPELSPMSGRDACLALIESIRMADRPFSTRASIAASIADRYACTRVALGVPAETAALILERLGLNSEDA
jgi:hypothetical protein